MLLLGGGLDRAAPGDAARVQAVVRRLDPAEQSGDATGACDPAEILNHMIAAGLRGDEGFWRSDYVPTGRAMVAALARRAEPSPPDMRLLPPRRFAIELQRTFFPSPASARAAATRLRLPLPIAGANLDDLSIAIGSSAGTPVARAGRIELRLPEFAVPVEITARYSFTACAGLSRPAEAPSSALLREREGAIGVTPSVRALAAQVAGDEADPARIVMGLRDHLLDRFMCGAINPAWLGQRSAPDWVIGHGWFDCRLGSILLASLCRARGIAARLIGGYLLWSAPIEHYWIEVWLPDRGWTPFDLLAWDLSAGGRDAEWRDIYAGAIDYRMTTQIFPDIFVGAPGVAMGAAWHRLPRAIPGGTETRFVSIPDGAPLFTETVRHLPA